MSNINCLYGISLRFNSKKGFDVPLKLVLVNKSKYEYRGDPNTGHPHSGNL